MKKANRGLFELCKQVYEVTGLSSDVAVDFYFDENGLVKSRFQTLSVTKKELPIGYTPFYTSDYLLEKLPFPTEIGCDSFSWIGKYENRGKQIWERAGTPLKALLKLTLKLH